MLLHVGRRVRLHNVSRGIGARSTLCVVSIVHPLFRGLQRVAVTCRFRDRRRRVRFFGRVGPSVLNECVFFRGIIEVRVGHPVNDSSMRERCLRDRLGDLGCFFSRGLSFCRCCHSETARLSACCFIQCGDGFQLYLSYGFLSGSPTFSAKFSCGITGVLSGRVLHVCLGHRLRLLSEGARVTRVQASLSSFDLG